KKGHPSPSWLKFVKTSKANSKIRRWLRSQNYEKNVTQGRDLILQRLKGTPLKITNSKLDEEMALVIRHTKFERVEDLYAEVGFGSYSVGRVVQRLEQLRRRTTKRAEQIKTRTKPQGVIVEGLEGVAVRFAG